MGSTWFCCLKNLGVFKQPDNFSFTLMVSPCMNLPFTWPFNFPLKVHHGNFPLCLFVQRTRQMQPSTKLSTEHECKWSALPVSWPDKGWKLLIGASWVHFLAVLMNTIICDTMWRLASLTVQRDGWSCFTFWVNEKARNASPGFPLLVHVLLMCHSHAISGQIERRLGCSCRDPLSPRGLKQRSPLGAGIDRMSPASAGLWMPF